MKFKNFYNNRKVKEEFFTKQENREELTDQSQITSASISAMAEKFGIDAVIAKAQQKNIESETLKAQLYGNDFSQMFKSKEEMLNTKNKLNRLFEKLPARIRKEEFNDNVVNFVNAYTNGDEKKLESLNKLGIVSDKQLNYVKNMNETKQAEKNENIKRTEFITKLENMKAGLYENYKKTGTINIDIPKDITVNNNNLQESL